MTKQTTDIPRQISEIRKRLGVSNQVVAQLVGTSLVAIEQWERLNATPSETQRQGICDLLERIHRGERPSMPAVVLQNGTFASRGATRRAMNWAQPDISSEAAKIQLQNKPTNDLLKRIKTDRFLGNSGVDLPLILAANQTPAQTPDEPARLDVSAGKNTYTYDAHTYHTKVPPQGIVEFAKHYLPQGGLILDPFCGSGMTGVAARIAGFDVILNELSPAACFISHNFTESVSPELFAAAIRAILDATDAVRRKLYTTECRECGRDTEILYTVWSYRVSCPNCERNFVLWDHCRKYGRTVREHKILKEFPCPNCEQTLQKRSLTRSLAVPVLLGYKCCAKHQVEHPLTDHDQAVIKSAESGAYLANGFFPTTPIPDGVNLNQPKRHGFDRVDKFYTMRNLSAMSQIWRSINAIEDNVAAAMAAFSFTSLYQRVTRLSEYRFWGGSGNTARFNVPYIFNEANVFVTFERKAASILDHIETTAVNYTGRKAVLCNSATDLAFLPDDCVDLIFTDPPFGANINYSEMNILWESWLGEFTNAEHEAIVSSTQGKDIDAYERLMSNSLSECYRVLRPGHWMLLVFMNSSSLVWDALMNAVRWAGFRTERLDIFDKQHGTFKQFVSENTAGCDLVLHCRKPICEELGDEVHEEVAPRDSFARFLKSRAGDIPVVSYLHVERNDEPDLRRMYSEWLAFALPRNHQLADFAEFRRLLTDGGDEGQQKE
jgi:DNA modification methylase